MCAEPSRKLILSNLDYEQDDEGILNMCRSFGEISHFNRPPLKKNFAFVLFKKLDAAQQAFAALRRNNVIVKYSRDELMLHNSLSSGQLSVDSNANMPIKTTFIGNEFKSYSASASDDGHSVTGIEKCVRCNMHAGLKCERCGDYYCSIECQTADWRRHRLICFPMPRLVKGKSMSNSVGTVARNESATTSPLRERVDTHDTMNGFAKMSLLDAESVIRKPLSPLANARNETKTADQPVNEVSSPLTPPSQLPVKPPAPAVKKSKFAKLDINCKKVVILDDGLFNCGKVACTDVKNKTAIVKNEQIIQNCGEKALQNGRFKPKVGDKCLVYVFEVEEPWWYRGECIRVNDEKALLLLLDSGKMHTAKLNDIREFDEKCDFEQLTTIATIKNVTVQDGKVSEEDQLEILNKLQIFEQADVEQIEYIGDDDCRIKFSCI